MLVCFHLITVPWWLLSRLFSFRISDLAKGAVGILKRCSGESVHLSVLLRHARKGRLSVLQSH